MTIIIGDKNMNNEIEIEEHKDKVHLCKEMSNIELRTLCLL